MSGLTVFWFALLAGLGWSISSTLISLLLGTLVQAFNARQQRKEFDEFRENIFEKLTKGMQQEDSTRGSYM